VNTFLRLVIIVLGIASLVFGIISIFQAGSGTQWIADDIAPLAIKDVDAKYDAVSVNQQKMMAAEEPNIQADKAAPSAMYNYLTVQRTGLGLARTNVGLVGFIRMAGIINVVLGLGLVLIGVAAPAKSKA
jgi:hypothetical protein